MRSLARAHAVLVPLALLLCVPAHAAKTRQEGPPPSGSTQGPTAQGKGKSLWSQTPFTPIAVDAVERKREEGGTHWRLGTSRGVVHVWRPQGYRASTAGTVLYIHGYYTNVDQAVEDHKLLAQFQASGRNALFIAPEAPSWNGEDVFWPDLDALLAEVTRLSEVKIPAGPLVVVGHSGAYRTVIPWLANPRLQDVVLLDGFYRGEDDFSAWLAGESRGKRRLLLVGLETARRTEAWLSKGYPDAIRHRRLPQEALPNGAPERRAPLVYVRSQQDHMEIVTLGTVMPEMLRWTRLRGL